MVAIARQTQSEFHIASTSVSQTAIRLTVLDLDARNYVMVQAAEDNTDNVFVGHSDSVSSSNGWRLDAGESVKIPIDTASKVWIIADADSQLVKWFVV